MAATKTILVTGAHGQLGSELKGISNAYPQFNFIFLGRNELAINDQSAVEAFFSLNKIDYCINCAAYTAVDLAESEPAIAMEINGIAPGYLASACLRATAILVHVSTDYVFDGTATSPYTETDPTSGINVYGRSKLAGEKAVMNNNPGAIIIRTSWVYGTYGKNFVKTMMRLMNERESINVVNDQLGSPTYTYDLASAILSILAQHPSNKGGIYHYCNAGVITWFEFAMAIKELLNAKCIVKPIPTSEFPTPAKRPHYSALNTEKFRNSFGLAIAGWRESLQACLQLLK